MNYKAIINGTFIFLTIFALNALILSYISSADPVRTSSSLPSTTKQSTETYVPITTAIVNSIYIFLNALMWFTPGIYVGYKLKKSGISHGAVIGALGALGAVIAYIIPLNLSLYDSYQELYQVAFGCLSTAFLCALAGGAGELYAIKGSTKGSNNAF